VHTKPIHGPGTSRLQIPVPDFVGVLGKLQALELALAAIIEEAELDLAGMRRKQRKVDAETVPRRAKRKRAAFRELRSIAIGADVSSPLECRRATARETNAFSTSLFRSGLSGSSLV
jgi:hypothetical protein